MHVKYLLFSFSNSKIWKNLRFGVRWWIWIPLSIAMSLLFSTGPMVQRYLVALLTSDETSIYGSSFEHSLVRLPKLDDWFDVAFTWPHPAIALIVVLFSLRESSIKQIFLKLALFGGATLLAVDIVYGLIRGELSIAVMFENFVANFVGAAGVASIAVLILRCADYGFAAFNWPLLIRRGIAGCFVILCGALALCAIFFLTDFFYRPRPANISLISDAPSEGFFIAKVTKKDERPPLSESDKTVKPFSLVSRGTESSSVNWRGPKNAIIKWSAGDSLLSYDVEVSLFTGCGPTNSDRQLPPSETSLIARGARNFSLSHDWGAWDTTIEARKGNGSAELTGPDSGFFWINASGDAKIDLQQFVTDRTELRYASEASPLEVFMIAPPAQPEETIQNKPKLNLDIDGKKHVISLPISSSIGDSRSFDCRAVSSRVAFEKKSLSINSYSGLFAVKVVIKPNLTSMGTNLTRNFVTIQGDGGWVKVRGVDPKALRSTDEDRLDMISLSGNFKDVTVNGVDRPPKIGDSYVAIGQRIRSSFVSGHFKISGNADLLWINSNRANQTKWESLPIEYKAAGFTFIGFVFLLLIRYTILLVKRNEHLAWLEDGNVGPAKELAKK